MAFQWTPAILYRIVRQRETVMSDENALVPVEQRTVLFYDDELVAVKVEDGTIYVPIRPI